jgi:hypothetical protein
MLLIRLKFQVSKIVCCKGPFTLAIFAWPFGPFLDAIIGGEGGDVYSYIHVQIP